MGNFIKLPQTDRQTVCWLPRFLLARNVRMIGGVVDIRTGARRAVLMSYWLCHYQSLLYIHNNHLQTFLLFPY